MRKLTKDDGPHGQVLAELAALKAMSVNELKEKWEALFSKPAPNNARNFLELRIGYRIQELAYGGLTAETRRALDRLADVLDTLDPDPSRVTRSASPYTFSRQAGVHQVRLSMPFASRQEVQLFKKGDELVIEIGTLRRHVGLPTSMANLQPVRATFEGQTLVVTLREVA